MVVKENGVYKYDNDIEDSIGRVKPFYGNFGIYLRAYTYIRSMGNKGLEEVSEAAVLNANYIKGPPPPCGPVKVLCKFKCTASKPISPGRTLSIMAFKFAPS